MPSAGGNVLTRKIGGLPGWAWGLGAVAIGGVYIWRKRSAAAAAAAATTAAGTTTGTTALPATTQAADYGAPGSFGGGQGLASVLSAIQGLQPVPPATTPAPGVATAAPSGQSQLGSGYGILNSQFPSQGVLSVPTAQGTFTELNSSNNPAYGGTPAGPGVTTYYQPQPGIFSPVQSGDTLNPGTPLFALAAAPPTTT